MAMPPSCLPNAAAPVPKGGQSDTTKGGIWNVHVEVSCLIPLLRVIRLTQLHTEMGPPDIPLGYYTHINYAFASIDPQTFRIAPMDNLTASLYQGVTALKRQQSHLEVWIAIGGWAFNDPGPTRTTFSDLAASEAAQDTFFGSLISFMQKNRFDGVDIDWEYPVTDERGGRPEDYVNFVTLVKRLREQLNQTGRKYGISITLVRLALLPICMRLLTFLQPTSYWYLRGFDIVNLEPHVDFLNVMSYDIRK